MKKNKQTDIQTIWSGCRLVLGIHLSQWSEGSSAEKVWRHVSDAGQQSPSVHAGPVGEDPQRADQHTHRVQQGLLLAGLHFPGPASPAVLPGRSQPHTALHGLGPHAAGSGVQWHPPQNQAQPCQAHGERQQRAPEADAAPAQTGGLPLFAAPGAPHHQQTHQLPRAAATPKASAALPAGLPFPHMRVSVALVQDTGAGSHSMNTHCEFGTAWRPRPQMSPAGEYWDPQMYVTTGEWTQSHYRATVVLQNNVFCFFFNYCYYFCMCVFEPRWSRFYFHDVSMSFSPFLCSISNQ